MFVLFQKIHTCALLVEEKCDFAKELIKKTISNGADIGTNTSFMVLWGIGATWIEK